MNSEDVRDTEDESARIFAWDAALDELDYYSLLDVSRDASPEELRRAYYRFALLFHPDARPDVDSDRLRALTRIFQRGVEAYRVLSNPRDRAHYALSLENGELRLLESSTPFVDPSEHLPTLHLACRSAGAKLFAQQAARAWARRDPPATRRALEEALRYDGNTNPDISRCLGALRQLDE
ncbi:MAG: J domain-containing protein [Polyangiaceae bacterium]